MKPLGITGTEAGALLKKHGFNELPSARPKNIWRIALEVMREPMFMLLISCGVLYMILGDYQEGSILMSAITLIIGITFYQYQKTERALDALKNLSSPRALVIRDGTEVRIPGREVVPGDCSILNEGDRIPADARLHESLNLTVDESVLTGESVPVQKTAGDSDEAALWSGTLVVKGRGIAIVTRTGLSSELGKIGASLQGITAEETRLHREMKILIRNLAIGGIFISVAVVALFYWTRGNFIHSLLTGLSSAMAILPEEFPVVLTIFLALGAWRLSRKHVLTRNPTAIETLGSATVLCSDKTGTITQNRMEVAALAPGDRIVTRTDFKKQLAEVSALMSAAHHASTSKSIDPMERALSQLHGTFHDDIERELLREYAFTREAMTMARIVRLEDGRLYAFAKGAPEAVSALCRLSDAEHDSVLRTVKDLAGQGMRVLGVARAEVAGPLPDSYQELSFAWQGLVALEDPVRPEVPQAIAECYQAGVRVIMITGDFPATAQSIARQIGLPADGKVVSGPELDAMTPEQLKAIIKQVTVFARVVPEQKLRIVAALKETGEVVAMTGDGVNDAPALKAAHIGIAMGQKGTDVAREASSLVLLDDNFASIVGAIRLGRKIFDNLQKAMSYILAIHIPIIGLTLLPAFVSTLPILLMPLHIVFLELIIDPVCSVAFESEAEEPGIMKRPPRKPNELFFGSRKILYSVFQGLLTLGSVVIVYFLSIREGHTEEEVRTIAFSTLIIGNIFLILSNLSRTESFLHIFTERNPAVKIIIAATVLVLVLVISLPGLQILFSFHSPGYTHFLSALVGATVVLAVLEGIKFAGNR
ncbi:MAG: cation-translocating P-type ATPase [Cyclobacteriaceae bacterium]|nr:cation-translocating P-type ATPase [Cyclobacteriaceae bacterium]